VQNVKNTSSNIVVLKCDTPINPFSPQHKKVHVGEPADSIGRIHASALHVLLPHMPLPLFIRMLADINPFCVGGR